MLGKIFLLVPILILHTSADDDLFHNFFLQGVQSEKCLTTNDFQNDGKVVTWECVTVNGIGNQDWLSLSPTTQVDEYYQLKNMRSGKCLTVKGGWTGNSTPVNQYDCYDGAVNQLWKRVYAEDGSTFLVDKNSGKCLTVAYGYTGNNGDVDIYECGGSANQKWVFIHLDHKV